MIEKTTRRSFIKKSVATSMTGVLAANAGIGQAIARSHDHQPANPQVTSGAKSRLLPWDDVKTILKRHDIVLDRPVASPYEGLVLGNADMGATIFGPPERLVFRLGKMDLWDARWNGENYQQPLPVSQLKELVAKLGSELDKEPFPLGRDDAWKGKEKIYPCMRMGADILVRVANGQAMPLAPTQRLCLEDGSFEMEIPLGWFPESPKIICRAFVSWQRNVLVLRFKMANSSQGGHLMVGLWRDPFGGRSWETNAGLGYGREYPSLQDPREGMLPPSELTLHGNTASLWQVIPGDAECPERGFAVTACCAEGVDFKLEPSGQAVVAARGHDEFTIFVGMASEFESPGSLERSKRLAQEAARDGYEALSAEHTAAWRDFWGKSAIELEEKSLEREWIHSSYSLGINARSKRPAPPLFGVCTFFDRPPWSGDRHNNWPEYSLRFWGAFGSNHEEQALNYSEFVKGYLPTAERIARDIYEVNEGAVYPMWYVDGSRQYGFHYTWGYLLYVTAVHAQNCWWHYQYFGDRKFLEETGYPVMRACANFFVELVKKNAPGDYTLWPTITAEIRGWTKDFALNKNNIEDLASVKFLMRAVLEASEILRADVEKRPAWRDLLDHLPAYPTLVVNGSEEFADVSGLKERAHYSHSVPLAPLWPAEDPDVIADVRLRRIAHHTVTRAGWVDSTRETMAMIRLGMQREAWQNLPKIFEKPSPWCAMELSGNTNSLIVNELLVTAWDGIVRVFPCWPLEKRARFRDLRTKGAFLVSAACDGGRVQSASILSERGNRLRVLPPWPKTAVVCQSNGRHIDATPGADGVLTIETTAGELYVLSAQ